MSENNKNTSSFETLSFEFSQFSPTDWYTNSTSNSQIGYTHGTILAELASCNYRISGLVTEDISLQTRLLKLRKQIVKLMKYVEVKIQCPVDENAQDSDEPMESTAAVKSKECKEADEGKQNPEKATVPNQIENTRVVPTVSGLDDIVGMWDIKLDMKTVFLLPKMQPQLFENRRRCNTILLFGPPGTGKTRLTHALAAEIKASFYCISSSDVLSQYVGMSEKTIKAMFQQLRDSQELSILFIDEIDAFCRKRTSDEADHNRRIKTELMCQMNNMEKFPHVYLIGATNCPWDIDSAILRRFQKRIYIPLPTSSERMSFFQHLVPNTQIQAEHFNQLVEKTHGYSGSDLINVVEHAQNYPLIELQENGVWKVDPDGFYTPYTTGTAFASRIRCAELSDLPCNSVQARKCNVSDFLRAIASVTPTVTRNDIEKYSAFRNK